MPGPNSSLMFQSKTFYGILVHIIGVNRGPIDDTKYQCFTGKCKNFPFALQKRPLTLDLLRAVPFLTLTLSWPRFCRECCVMAGCVRSHSPTMKPGGSGERMRSGPLSHGRAFSLSPSSFIFRACVCSIVGGGQYRDIAFNKHRQGFTCNCLERVGACQFWKKTIETLFTHVLMRCW